VELTKPPERRKHMKAKDVLSDPSKWTQGVMARNRRGNPTGPEYKNAVAWCLVGSLIRAYGIGKWEDESRAVRRAIRSIWGRFDADYGSIEGWNDDPTRTFEGVRRVIEISDV
jgi:hypothetical protein